MHSYYSFFIIIILLLYIIHYACMYKYNVRQEILLIFLPYNHICFLPHPILDLIVYTSISIKKIHLYLYIYIKHPTYL
ncbi:hypothetical protein CLU79DRAFT_751157 [Phycomyces nitens]|nr:hypothetical protein CLU79DRAFT_751157 [Phycomyces nitens]